MVLFLLVTKNGTFGQRIYNLVQFKLRAYIKLSINSKEKVLAHFEHSVLRCNKNVECHRTTCANPCITKEGIWKFRVPRTTVDRHCNDYQ